MTMQWENAQLWNTVSKYARQAAKAKEDEVAAAHREGRQLKVYWADLDPPKVRSSQHPSLGSRLDSETATEVQPFSLFLTLQEIGDMVEALIGGLMVDGGFSGIEPRLYFFDVLFEPFFNKYIKGFRSLPNRTCPFARSGPTCTFSDRCPFTPLRAGQHPVCHLRKEGMFSAVFPHLIVYSQIAHLRLLSPFCSTVQSSRSPRRDSRGTMLADNLGLPKVRVPLSPQPQPSSSGD